jgi:hypothetical protein
MRAVFVLIILVGCLGDVRADFLCGSGRQPSFKGEPLRIVVVKPKELAAWTLYYKKLYQQYDYPANNDSQRIAFDTTRIQIDEYISYGGPIPGSLHAVRDSDQYSICFWQQDSSVKYVKALVIDSIVSTGDTSIVHYHSPDPLLFPDLVSFLQQQDKLRQQKEAEEKQSTITTTLCVVILFGFMVFLVRILR